MEDKIRRLLPYIMETLRRKPEMFATYENLKNVIKKAFPNESEDDFNDALLMGQGLGILTLSDDLVSISYTSARRRLKDTKKEALTDDEATGECIVQPRRTYTVPPNRRSCSRKRCHSRSHSRRRWSRY